MVLPRPTVSVFANASEVSRLPNVPQAPVPWVLPVASGYQTVPAVIASAGGAVAIATMHKKTMRAAMMIFRVNSIPP
jgi:hypothetical protein